MTLFIVFFGLMIILGIFAPHLANILAWLVMITFSIPFFTFFGGSLAWSIINACSAEAHFSTSSLLYCCIFIGFPFGLAMTYFTLKLGPK